MLVHVLEKPSRDSVILLLMPFDTLTPAWIRRRTEGWESIIHSVMDSTSQTSKHSESSLHS